MLAKNEAYNAELYLKADKPPVARELLLFYYQILLISYL